MSNREILYVIGIMASVTFVTRAIVFLLFTKRKTPLWMKYLSKVLPSAIMGFLVVYCLKGVSFTIYPYAFREVVSLMMVVVLHVYKRNTLISISVGTIVYMMLLHIV